MALGFGFSQRGDEIWVRVVREDCPLCGTRSATLGLSFPDFVIGTLNDSGSLDFVPQDELVDIYKLRSTCSRCGVESMLSSNALEILRQKALQKVRVDRDLERAGVPVL